jgi:hypothetical protein
MMPAASARTALALLFGPAEDTPGELAHRMLSGAEGGKLGSALQNLPEATREAAGRQISTTAAGLLDVNLADVLVAAWRKHKDLNAAARRTLAAPGSTELVDLASHRVTAAQEPYISIVVDGHRVATIRFELSLVFDVSALLAEIHAGRLAALHSGRCGIIGALAIQGIEAVSRQAHLDVPGIIPLRQGIRLLPADNYPADEGNPGSRDGSICVA